VGRDHVPAFSITAELAGDDGAILLSSAGGVRLASHLGAAGKLVLVPTADLLGDGARVALAVDRAMAPLVAALATPAAP
jgi:hypothetical protein